MIIDDRRNSWSNIGKTNYDSTERRFDDEARCGIISARAEGVDMPTGKTRSRCAWEAVNAPAIRGLHSMCRGCGNGDRNLRTGGAKK